MIRWTFRIAGYILLSGLFVASAAAFMAWNQLPPAPDHLVEETELSENSFFYDRRGRMIGLVQGTENRFPIALRSSGRWTSDAVVALEDERFWRHDGIDVEAIMRSAWMNVRSGSRLQGGSTITQQLVRTGQPELSTLDPWQRKIYEVQIARGLEKQLAHPAQTASDDKPKYIPEAQVKQQVLQRYLNSVYFGHGAYGIEAAARTFFARPAKQLTLAQSAVLAGLIQSPSTYDPYKPQGRVQAMARKDVVLSLMHAQGLITEQERAYAVAEKPHWSSLANVRKMPFVQDEMRRQINTWYGPEALKQGGLHVRTTIDPRAQSAAENVIAEHLSERGDPAAALVTIDNKTGSVLAMASSAQYQRSQFNLATQAKRQPGSSAKIWALAALVQTGTDPRRLAYTSMPIKVQRATDTEWWEPATYSGSFAGKMDLRSATLQSDNSVYAQMSLDLGPEWITRTARQWGISSDLKAVPSISLGSQEVSVLEQTNFYSTIARGGLVRTPGVIRQIKHVRHGVVPIQEPAAKRVADSQRVSLITSWLADNIRYGTGTAAQLSGGREAAGKTGTTDEYKDAWFCGFTAQLTTCVWVGYVQPKPMLDVHGRRIAGGTIPAEIWGDYNNRVHEKLLLPLQPIMQDDPPRGEDLWPNLSWQASSWLHDPALAIEQPVVKALGER